MPCLESGKWRLRRSEKVRKAATEIKDISKIHSYTEFIHIIQSVQEEDGEDVPNDSRRVPTYLCWQVVEWDCQYFCCLPNRILLPLLLLLCQLTSSISSRPLSNHYIRIILPREDRLKVGGSVCGWILYHPMVSKNYHRFVKESSRSSNTKENVNGVVNVLPGSGELSDFGEEEASIPPLSMRLHPQVLPPTTGSGFYLNVRHSGPEWEHSYRGIIP